jgi:hypothetical protein
MKVSVIFIVTLTLKVALVRSRVDLILSLENLRHL